MQCNVMFLFSPIEAGLERLKEYKKAAVLLKRNGDVVGALNFLKLSKALETALNAAEAVDLFGQFPPLPEPEPPSEIGHPAPPREMTKVMEQTQSHSEGTVFLNSA